MRIFPVPHWFVNLTDLRAVEFGKIPQSQMSFWEFSTGSNKFVESDFHVEFLRALGSQSSVSVWQHTLVGQQWQGLL